MVSSGFCRDRSLVADDMYLVFHRVGLTLDLFQLDTSTTAGSVIGADSIQELADD